MQFIEKPDKYGLCLPEIKYLWRLSSIKQAFNFFLLIYLLSLQPRRINSGNYVEYINKKKWQLKSDCKDSEKKESLFSM